MTNEEIEMATPGEWKVEIFHVYDNPEMRELQITADNGFRKIAVMPWYGRGNGPYGSEADAEDLANAHLIVELHNEAIKSRRPPSSQTA